MKQQILFWVHISFSLLLSSSVFGQVGINTKSPASTLDVMSTNVTSNIDGIQAPRLTLSQLTNKGDVLYGADQVGTIVYITDASTGNKTGQRANITLPGYYFFNGSVWIKLGVHDYKTVLGRVKNSFQTSDHDGWYLLDGRAITAFPANVQTAAKSLGFATALPDSRDRVLKSKTGAETLGSIGGSNVKTITRENLPNISLSSTINTTTSSNGAHTHTFSATSSDNGGHTHTLSATSASVGHQHSLSLTSTNTAHTHTFSATSTNNGAHVHGYNQPTRANTTKDSGGYSSDFNMKSGQVTRTTATAGAHTHTFSGTSASGGAAHTHTVSGTVANGGAAHTHAFSGTSASGGAAHTHTFSGTSASDGAAHTHALTGTVAVPIKGNSLALDNKSAYYVVNTFVYLGV
ncbi:hypothetical protein [Dysgonomonas sp. GY617]|uniref:hypothetical protein n=2 Tax=unclassified Dysgonomonas TaxID=2630389 RepID=UPI00188488CE|nr:hypothetical protein [Dysgonomonas sp. GY617]MBF0576313.1 hypothetical protein [Dysgonomonas sp. GY617]